MAESSSPKLCDICSYRDNFRGLTMLTCKRCGLFVHKECYGYETTKKNIICWACQAIGKSFQIEKFDEDGNRMSMVQSARPMSCALCSVKDGIHAMHPLYDKYGPTGRQMVIRHPTQPHMYEDQLAWVHSLCAFFISESQALVYGCTRQGDYNGQDDDDNDDSDDERSINPYLTETIQAETTHESVHHFVYYIRRPGQDHNPWTKRISDYQNNLQCFLCGRSDKSKFVYRIPIQCFANSDNEFKDFKSCHREMAPDENCTQAMHVGCAKWKGNTNFNRVYFFPGSNPTFSEPVANMFCNAHARDIHIFTEREHSKHKQKKSQRKIQYNSRATKTNNVARVNKIRRSIDTSDEDASAFGDNGDDDISNCDNEDDSDDGSSTPERQKDARQHLQQKVASKNNSANKRNNNKNQRFQTTKKRLPPTLERRQKKKLLVAAEDVTLQATQYDDGRKVYRKPEAIIAEHFDRNEAVSVKKMPRPKLRTKRTNETTETRKQEAIKRALQDIKKDIRNALCQQNERDRKQSLFSCKAKWKRNIGLLPRIQFEQQWKQTKAEVLREMDKEQKEAEATDADPPIQQEKSNNQNNARAQPEVICIDSTTDEEENDENDEGKDDDDDVQEHPATEDDSNDDDNSNGNNEATCTDAAAAAATSTATSAVAVAAANPAATISNTTAQPDLPPELQYNRWSYLAVGPYHIGNYSFGDWDSKHLIWLDDKPQPLDKNARFDI